MWGGRAEIHAVRKLNSPNGACLVTRSVSVIWVGGSIASYHLRTDCSRSVRCVLLSMQAVPLSSSDLREECPQPTLYWCIYKKIIGYLCAYTVFIFFGNRMCTLNGNHSIHRPELLDASRVTARLYGKRNNFSRNNRAIAFMDWYLTISAIPLSLGPFGLLFRQWILAAYSCRLKMNIRMHPNW